MAAAEVRYVNGPIVNRTNRADAGVLRGEAAMWVRVGKSEHLRPILLSTQQIAKLMLACAEILHERSVGVPIDEGH